MKYIKEEIDIIIAINPIQDYSGWAFRGCSRMGGAKRPPPKNLSQIPYNDETCHSYTFPKEGPKIIKIT